MPLNQPLSALEQHDDFIGRHIGPCASEMAAMLATIGADSLDQLIDQTVPAAIPLPADLPLPAPRREHEALADLKALASKNVINKSCIGMGYYDTLTPKVILRNVMENPGWYTAYTPYQAEIADMLAAIGAASLDQLIDQTVPAAIRLPADLPLPPPLRDHQALAVKIRTHLESLPPYTPIEPFEVLSARIGRDPSQIVKLDANENPYGILPAVRKALAEMDFPHIYPDPESRALRQSLAKFTGVDEDYLLAGSGADELLDLLMRVFLERTSAFSPARRPSVCIPSTRS